MPVLIGADGVHVPWKVRPCGPADRTHFVRHWATALERLGALDAQWKWSDLESECAFPAHAPESVVLVEDSEPEVPLGILVTSGPIRIDQAGLDPSTLDGDTTPLVWVEYIAIAPELRSTSGSRPRLKGLGPVLMRHAIRRSRELECGGRIGLHAEGSLAATTYETKWTMKRLPDAPHPAGGSFPVYFGSAAWARGFLKEAP